MEIFATIIGLVLAVAGLFLGYFAHPSVVERIKRNKDSNLFKFQNFLFGKVSTIEPGLSMTLYDIIYDDVRSKEFYEIIKRRYYDLDFIKNDLYSEMNIKFIFLENFLDDCNELRFNPFDVIASIIVEFAWHRRLYLTMKQGVEFELATADGFFVKLCSIELKGRNTQFELRSLERISNQISKSKNWGIARDFYFIARSMPHRSVFTANPVDFFDAKYRKSIRQISEELSVAVTNYTLQSTDLPGDWRGNSAVLVAKLQKAERDISRYEYDQQLLTDGELISNFEYIISLSHKILFGKSAMHPNSGAARWAFDILMRVWSECSIEMVEAANPPTVLALLKTSRIREARVND